MTPSITDYQLSAAGAARRHLEALCHDLRVRTIHAWLVANRTHHRAKHVDELMTDFRLGGVLTALNDAEVIVERHLEL